MLSIISLLIAPKPKGAILPTFIVKRPIEPLKEVVIHV